MNLSCEVVADLLPLYQDGVCGEESRRAVEAHLAECEACRGLLTVMGETSGAEGSAGGEWERKKAESFRSVKKKLLWKQVLTVCAVLLLLAGAAFAVARVLKNTVREVVYEGNISVSMVDGALVGRLRGSRESCVRIKRVSEIVDGQEKNYLFFTLSDTEWDRLTTHSEVFSEYLLCAAEKGAGEIDGVYYRTGEDEGLENKTGSALHALMDESVLLWSRESE